MPKNAHDQCRWQEQGGQDRQGVEMAVGLGGELGGDLLLEEAAAVLHRDDLMVERRKPLRDPPGSCSENRSDIAGVVVLQPVERGHEPNQPPMHTHDSAPQAAQPLPLVMHRIGEDTILDPVEPGAHLANAAIHVGQHLADTA
jgi:hypothetical protein